MKFIHKGQEMEVLKRDMRTGLVLMRVGEAYERGEIYLQGNGEVGIKVEDNFYVGSFDLLVDTGDIVTE